MVDSAASMVVNKYCSGHHLILNFLQKLSDAELRWSLASGSLSIAWHGWHLARWADYTQAAIPGMTPELGRRLGTCVQVWHRDGLADRWGFTGGDLGYAETGMDMADAIAWHLPFPPKEVLLEYIGQAFAVADKAASAIDDAQFICVEQPQALTEGVWGESTVGDAILVHVMHDYRHLGMMECLLGLQGKPGTATR